MSAAKHTTGPWNAIPSPDETAWMIGPRDTAGDDYVADVHKLTSGRSDEDSEANARLIAAAPELLAELTTMVGLCPGCSGDGLLFGTDSDPCPVCTRARAAIAKAEGGAK